MEGALRPSGIDKTIVEILLNVLNDLLKVSLRIHLNDIWLVVHCPKCRSFAPDDILLASAESDFDIMVEKRNSSSFIRRRDLH